MHPYQQPYARGMGSRAPGHALAAMLNGRTLYGGNPMDRQRGDPQLPVPPMGLAALLLQRYQAQGR